MICRYGSLVVAQSPKAQSKAAAGFFDLFYQWSSISCAARTSSRRSTRSLYTQSQCRVRSVQASWTRSSSSAASASATAIPTSSLSNDLRKVMRTLPHSVVVLTTSDPNSKPPESQSRGMTLSSFTTLTLTPQPIVTFNIRRPSLTLSALLASRSFNIHILSSTLSGAQLADAFTRGNSGRDPFVDAMKNVEGLGVDEQLVLSAPGVVRVLKCEILSDGGCVEVGDHGLVLGRVVEIMRMEGKQDKEAHGLCYADGRYRGVGQVIALDGE